MDLTLITDFGWFLDYEVTITALGMKTSAARIAFLVFELVTRRQKY